MTVRQTKYQKVYKKDARALNEILHDKIVDVTVTSPPYFDLKDYGYKEQIGYGQDYQNYLEDLKIVFKNVYDCTKDNGTLWVVIDSFRKKGEVTPLPFDFSNKLKEIGWKLQDVIIWVKDRTVPWAHQGQMRNLFEYILLFSKSNKYNFFLDDVRDFESLKKWWVKYPERYNPKGKVPDGLWHFDIPTQGSWGNGYIKHFCPLPEELIEQILKISTKENSLVLDPFAGSGAVLAKADNMMRNYIGFEMNQEYIDMFNKYISETGEQKRNSYQNRKTKSITQKKFNQLIIELRELKFARIFYSKLPESLSKQVVHIYVSKTPIKPTSKNARCVTSFLIHVLPKTNSDIILAALNKLITTPPLSKFGIQPIFEIIKSPETLKKKLGNDTIYTYTTKATHKFKNKIKADNLSNLPKTEIILSKIKVDLYEKDYE